jgi:hypothetical protein
VRANAIRWSPLTTPLKPQLCYDQTNRSPTCSAAEAEKTFPYPRAAINRVLKDQIMDDCLSDAVIYQGKARDEISAQVQKAIVQASATSGGNIRVEDILSASSAVPTAIPLVFITDSLGSKVTFDAIWKLTTERSTAAAGQRQPCGVNRPPPARPVARPSNERASEGGAAQARAPRYQQSFEEPAVSRRSNRQR